MRLCSSVAAAVFITLCAVAFATPASAVEVCTFSVVSGVGFGTYDVFNALPTTANGSITYQCAGLPVAGKVVTLLLSRGAAPTYTPRFMVNGAQHLQYNLYLDAAFSKIWGNGTGTTSIYSATTLNGVPTLVTIFGRITAGQDLTAGIYKDTITVTMNW